MSHLAAAPARIAGFSYFHCDTVPANTKVYFRFSDRGSGSGNWWDDSNRVEATRVGTTKEFKFTPAAFSKPFRPKMGSIFKARLSAPSPRLAGRIA